MSLSVVIPAFNTAAMTLRCCRSLAGASEVIVVDDGSTDGTAELLAHEARVVRLDGNRGFAAAANRGVAEANGELILLLNSDAVADANALAAIREAFERDPRLGIAGAQLLNEDGTPQWSGGPTPTLAWMIGVVSGVGHWRRRLPRNSPRTIDWVSGAAMAFRREVWRDAGPLSERYRFYCQDLEFCLRARKAGWDVRVVDAARVTHAMGATIAGDNALRHDPASLWPDLLAWGGATYGRTWAAFARMALVLTAAARVALSKHDPALRRGLRALYKS